MVKRPVANEFLQWIADAYVHDKLNQYRPVIRGHYVQVDQDRSERIAAEFERAEVPEFGSTEWHETRNCYRMLEVQTLEQWEYLVGFGFTFEPWDRPGQPYKNSLEMAADLRDNKHLYFFTGGDEHPFLCEKYEVETGRGIGHFNGNELLRAVHDVFGHATEGFGFGARGEENAWIHHSMMFSEMAQAALTTETRGQNSWVNFGPFSHLPVDERPFAAQKTVLLPEWVRDWKASLRQNALPNYG